MEHWIFYNKENSLPVLNHVFRHMTERLELAVGAWSVSWNGTRRLRRAKRRNFRSSCTTQPVERFDTRATGVLVEFGKYCWTYRLSTSGSNSCSAVGVFFSMISLCLHPKILLFFFSTPYFFFNVYIFDNSTSPHSSLRFKATSRGFSPKAS